ncbi:MAG: thiamine diphosphokinase [Boseongicola sp.]|nr:thiamine diphosphokinase [Silicimonas sp.]NNF92823.1 thiamine diphosphokinase [Boseongicola sp.]
MPSRRNIDDALCLAPTLIAADGGAEFCLNAERTPEAVIGDFDSLDPTLMARLRDSRLIRVTEQETTDFEKSLNRIDAPFILATGFTAGRVDHSLAVWAVLARRTGPPTLVIGDEDVVFAAPRRISIEVASGVRISLFPMTATSGRSTGLEWPIDGLTLSPLGQLGTSNLSTGPVRLDFDVPGCLVIMPREALAEALSALIG